MKKNIYTCKYIYIYLYGYIEIYSIYVVRVYILKILCVCVSLFQICSTAGSSTKSLSGFEPRGGFVFQTVSSNKP